MAELPPSQPLSKESLQQVLQLKAQTAGCGLEVIPGERWALHYPSGEMLRPQLLEEVRAGRVTPQAAAPFLRPDGLIYPLQELETQGVDAFQERVQRNVQKYQHYDYERFGEFLARFQEAEVDTATLEYMYERLTQNRAEEEMIRHGDAPTRDALLARARHQLDTMIPRLNELSPTDRLFETLNADWACENQRLLRTEARDAALETLQGQERETFDHLRDVYREFVNRGERESFERLVEILHEALPNLMPEGDDESPEDGEPVEGVPPDSFPDSKDLRKRVREKASQVRQGKELPEADDSELKNARTTGEAAQEQVEAMRAQQTNLNRRVEGAESFEDLEAAKKEAEGAELLDEMANDVKNRVDAKTEQMKTKLQEKIENMHEDGFVSEEKSDQLESKLRGEKDLKKLESLEQEVEESSELYDQYTALREEVWSLVEEWYRYFVERLPREPTIEVDEDSLTRTGAFNRRSTMKFRNLIMGTVKNPRVIRPSIKPRFIASLVVDVSGSMKGEKLRNAMKMLVFYCELFSRIGREFGYIRWAIDAFSDHVHEIKTYSEDYDSQQPYEFSDGTSSTIKMRMMQAIQAKGDSNILAAVQRAAAALSEQIFEHRDHASAMYYMGDGGDSANNRLRIRDFLASQDAESGFGDHMKSATFLSTLKEGDTVRSVQNADHPERDSGEGETFVVDAALIADQRRQLAELFGEGNTVITSNFEELVEESMLAFDRDIEFYTKDKVAA